MTTLDQPGRPPGSTEAATAIAPSSAAAPRRVDVWSAMAGPARAVAARARALEAHGWGGIGVVDSQNLSSDVFVSLAAGAVATERILLASAVTNPVTRHPAVTAGAAASLQAVSDGRMVLGIGRGDSALAHLGKAPAPVDRFERYLELLQAYLSGDEIPFDADDPWATGVRPAGDLHLAGAPTASRLRWVDGRQPKVPVDVAATGPRVIAAAARHADAITFAVGVEPERLRWAIATARQAAVAAGRDPATLQLGTYVPVCVHPDVATARRLLSGGVASYARFSVMHGSVSGPTSEEGRRTLESIHGAYDMEAHFRHGSPQSEVLTDEVIDGFGIVGPSEHCVEQLQGLVALGLTRLFIMGGGLGVDRDEAVAAERRFVADVLPHLQGVVAPAWTG